MLSKIVNLSIFELKINNKNYYYIATNIFQRYITKNFEGLFFWESIKINFKNRVKKIRI